MAMNRKRRFTARTAFLALAALAWAIPALAATFTVNSTEDAVDIIPGDGICASALDGCTLRAAIQEANASAGADTIVLPAGTYVLDIPGLEENTALTGDLDIASDLTISGAGAKTTIIDGNEIDRVFHVQSGATLNLSGVIVRNGNSTAGTNKDGGGINNQGTTTIDNVAVNGNTSGNGGGVYNNGTLTITNSTLSNNVADPAFPSGWGGAIYNNSTATLTNVTISGNTADTGAGILMQPGTIATIFNCTIANNSGAFSSGVGLMGNGGFSGSVKKTILSNNLMGSGLGSSNCYQVGNSSADGYNISSDATCSFSDVTDNVNTNPLLGPLQDNGGPTMTHALLEGSPAIDRVPGAQAPATDQRGITRPQVGKAAGSTLADIGAYEAVYVAPVPPPASSSSGGCSVSGSGGGPGEIPGAFGALLLILVGLRIAASRRLSRKTSRRGD